MALDSTARSAPQAWAMVRGSRRGWCFGIGALTSLLAVGGRWDVALAAWAAPLLILRFSRDSSTPVAIGGVTAVSLGNVLWWSVQLGVPLQPSVIGFSVILGVVFALPFVLDRLLTPRLGIAGRLLVLPTAIVASELVVGVASPLGTSYGLHAVTQSENLALLQLTSITGPYGIGFLIGLSATTLNHLWERPAEVAARRGAAALVGLLLAVVVAGQARLALLAPGPGAERVKIAGVTPSIEGRERARGATAPETTYSEVLEELILETRRAAAAGAQIIVWSETAAPVVTGGTTALLERTAPLARELGAYINVALGIASESNETLLLNPRGQTAWSYQKNHPVPGLEPVPPADTPVPLVDSPFGRLSNMICFDADFPALARVKADIMLVPGWDWPEMGRTHTLKMARLRAVENGYSLVRVDYNGESAAFDYLGNLLGSQDTTRNAAGHTLMVDVPVRGVATVYGAIGDTFGWLCIVTLAGLACWAGMSERRE